MSLKGQSAIEYLTTYGWMLIVAGLVGGIIFAVVSDSCQISSSGFSDEVRVSQVGVDSTGELEVVLENQAPDTVSIENITLSSEDGERNLGFDREVDSGSEQTFSLNNVGDAGSCNQLDMEIIYEDSITSFTTGTIRMPYSLNATVTDTLDAAFSDDGPQNIGQTVNFDASASDDSNGTISSYSWDFGDGDTGSGETATHSYSSAGTYTVELTVTNDEGDTDTEVSQVEIQSTNNPPTATTKSDKTVAIGETVQFNASESSDPDGDSLSYYWDFDEDGITESNIREPTYSYGSGGTYTVNLTVSDGEYNRSDTVNVDVTTYDLVVDKNDGSNYDVIDYAVGNASSGDSILIKTATYDNPVAIDKNISITGQGEVTLNGDRSSTGLTMTTGGLSVNVSGLDIVGWETGVSTYYESGDYVFEGLNVSNNGDDNGGSGLSVYGDIVFRDSVVSGNDQDEFDTVGMEHYNSYYSDSSVVLENVSFSGNGEYGLDGGGSGSYVVNDSVFRDTLGGSGLYADSSGANWSLNRVNLTGNSDSGLYAGSASGKWWLRDVNSTGNGNYGVYASSVTGFWNASDSAFYGNDVSGYSGAGSDFYGVGADQELDLERNWWGSSGGPNSSSVRGNVSVDPFCDVSDCSSYSGFSGSDLVALNVGSGEEYADIQWAIDSSGSGDIVRIYEGVYDRSGLTVDHNLSLEAENGNVTLRGDRSSTGFSVSTGGLSVNVSGLDIVGWETGVSTYYESGDYVFEGLNVSNNGDDNGGSGLSVYGDIVFRDSVVSGNDQDEFDTVGMEHYNSYYSDSSVVLENVSFSGNGEYGLDGGGSGSYVVNDSVFRESVGDGIYAGSSSADWNLTSVNITNNEDGIDADGATGKWFLRNANISQNSYYGVYANSVTGFWNASDSVLAKNNQSGTGYQDFHATDSDKTLNLKENWWGQDTGPESNQYSGSIEYTPYCTDSECTSTS